MDDDFDGYEHAALNTGRLKRIETDPWFASAVEGVRPGAAQLDRRGGAGQHTEQNQSDCGGKPAVANDRLTESQPAGVWCSLCAEPGPVKARTDFSQDDRQ